MIERGALVQEAIMEVRFWAQTDVGRQRDHNEDSFLVDKRLNLFVCCDGMGGHAAGEVASSAAVHEFRKFLSERREILEKYAAGHAMVDRRDLLELMELGVHHACNRVHQLAQLDTRRKGMGTTLVAMLLCGNRGFIAHVGDSRIYLLREQEIHQLTEDHSLVNELIRRGKLKPGQELSQAYRNAVTRAVGVYPSVEVDTLDLDLMAGDRFLLCSDGLSGYLDVEDEAFLPLFTRTELDEVPQAFIDFANDRGGKDNITAVLVEVVAESALKELSQEIQLKLAILENTPLFKYLTYKERVAILNATTTVEMPAESVVVNEGDEGEAFFILLSGALEVKKGDQLVTTLMPGAHFGEMALVDKSQRSASIRTTKNTRMLRIDREDFFLLLRKDRQLAVKMLWAFVQVLTVRLRRSTEELVESRTEMEIFEAMEPLFDDDEPMPVPIIEPTLEMGQGDAEALASEEIAELQADEDVVADKETYAALTRAAEGPPPLPDDKPGDAG